MKFVLAFLAVVIPIAAADQPVTPLISVITDVRIEATDATDQCFFVGEIQSNGVAVFCFHEGKLGLVRLVEPTADGVTGNFHDISWKIRLDGSKVDWDIIVQKLERVGQF